MDATIFDFDKIHEVDLKKTMEDSLRGLRHERYRLSCAPGRPGRSEAGTAKSAYTP